MKLCEIKDLFISLQTWWENGEIEEDHRCRHVRIH